MTSRTLSNRFAIGEFKNRIWIYIFMLIATAVREPIGLLIQIDAFMSMGYMSHEDIAESLRYGVSDCNTFMAIVMGFVFTLMAFGFVYSKSKVDMVHSLAIKRKDLFVSEFLTALIPSVAIQVINVVLVLVVVLGKGFMTHEIMLTAIWSLFSGIILTIAVICITAIAIMLTANLFIGICGAITLLVYADVMYAVIDSYCSICYQTYYSAYFASESWISVILGLPLVSGYESLGEFTGVVKLLVVIAEVVLLYFAARKLYLMRPSECTNKPLCYNITKPIIRICVVVLCSLTCGLSVFLISETISVSWYWFAMIGSAVIVHAILDAIFEQNFKKVFANWPQLILALVISAGISLLIQYDVFGYDRYMPENDKVESASVSLLSIENGMQWYDFERDANGISINNESRRLKETNLSDKGKALAIAECGIKSLDPERSAFVRNRVKALQHFEDPTVSEYIVCYHMKNGRQVYRRYRSNIELAYNVTKDVYEDASYRATQYQIEEIHDKVDLTKVELYDCYGDIKTVFKSADIDEMFDCYAIDLQNRTLDQLKNGMIVGTFSSYSANSNNDYSAGYVIYNNDKNTIDFLKKKGIELPDSRIKIAYDDIVALTPYDYRSNGDVAYDNMNEKLTKDDNAELIKAISDAMVVDSYTYINSVLNPYVNGIDINVEYKKNGEVVTAYASIPCGEMPVELEAFLGNK